MIIILVNALRRNSYKMMKWYYKIQGTSFLGKFLKGDRIPVTNQTLVVSEIARGIRRR